MSILTGKEALIALANGQEVEFLKPSFGEWELIHGLPINVVLEDSFSFRLKPQIIRINGFECPAPVTCESLPADTKFWIADPSRHDGEFCRYLVWDGQPCDIQHLKRGLVHLSKENADTHAKAIILASGGHP